MVLCFLQVAKILYSFATTFRRVPKHRLSTANLMEQEQTAIFGVSIEIKEDDGKGNYSYCPVDKSQFKFRCDSEKKLCITVSQCGTRELKIER